MKSQVERSVWVILTECSQPQDDGCDDDAITVPYDSTAVDLVPTSKRTF